MYPVVYALPDFTEITETDHMITIRTQRYKILGDAVHFLRMNGRRT